MMHVATALTFGALLLGFNLGAIERTTDSEKANQVVDKRLRELMVKTRQTRLAQSE